MAFAPIPEDLKKGTTINQQIDKTFSSAISTVGGGASGALSPFSTSVGDTLSNISAAASVLGKLGISAGTAVSTAINELGVLGPYSKFNDTFKPPSKINDITPEQSQRNKLRYEGMLVYPENIGEYWIQFEFVTYSKQNPLALKTESPTLTIDLPIPTNLEESFNMQYSEKELGVLGALESKLMAASTGANLGTKEGAEEFGKNLASQAADPTFLAYGARALTGIADVAGFSATAALEKTAGAVLNPFQSLLFQGVNLRSHSFSYRFSPNSLRENETLKKIIHEFKRRMHPAKEGILLKFPELVNIKFGHKEGEPYFFKQCFLESMSVNYAPSGTPAFFAESRNPVEVSLNLNFRETEIMTRDDIDKRGAPQSYVPLGPY